MFLLEKPYASDFLIKTIRENKYKVVATPEAMELLNDKTLSWISEDDAARELKEKPETPLYTNSENALAWVADHLQGSEVARQSQLFKDKFRFRELIKDLYPNFLFRTVALNEIQQLNIEEGTFPFVIKPSVGFFSIGVHVVKDGDDWENAKKELDINRLENLYPQNVLDTSTFIIEEYIEGEEYAIDCYFNQKGEVVILNILHHKFSSGADTSDRVYSTSKKIILQHKEDFGKFLQKIGKKAKLKNFPAHVEVRINERGEINPIEINPGRYGGWCTTADLLGLAFGYNSYEYYQENDKPDWDKIFKGNEEKKYSIIVLNNNSGYESEEIEHFDYELLGRDFEKPIEIRKLDPGKFSVFGFVFVETSPGFEEELDRILVSDLRKYITLR
jgi:hypothetical protein